MKSFTDNDGARAIKKARAFFAETGEAVEVHTILGDPIIYITDTGREYIYD